MQIDNVFTAYFLDTATAPGAPLTGLSATITIVDVSDNSTAVNNVAMTEIGLGFYKYVFAGYSSSKDYVYSCNPNSLLAYIQSGVTDKRLDNLDKSISEITAKGGGSIQLGGIDSKLAKVIEKLSEEKEIIDFTPILNKIDSIEIPKQKEVKLEEKEAKKALKAIQILDKKQNIILEYIDKDKSEKEELGMLSREFTRVEMEHEEKKMKHEEEMRQKEIEDKKREEEEKKMEEENDKKLLEEIKSEFAKLEEEDKVEKKKELEMELKEMEKEMKEKEKELKKL